MVGKLSRTTGLFVERLLMVLATFSERNYLISPRAYESVLVKGLYLTVTHLEIIEIEVRTNDMSVSMNGFYKT